MSSSSSEAVSGHLLLGLVPLGLGELAERLFELSPHALERRLRLGGDHGADELQREANRARLERRQPRRAPERVAEELLVHADVVAVERRVDRVAPAAEVDEVEELQMVVELVRRDVEAVDELLRGNDRPGLVAAAREQVREQSLEDAEALRRERPCRSLERLDHLARLGPGRLRRLALVALEHAVEPVVDLVRELRR